ncbi:PTS sugar transporter subunit IIA [Citrobacter portucalensis]|uniref:PTS sugar transporter subunit IIA n=1 Tax=Citrobacter portucalensis TaxID=1639133 RepID=A0AAW5WDZ7_9ENTR|nr:PTS sugar transporter subunit IIA [Citrobacter portucalensis]MCX9003556.1 PTS sugar transporter subunit IIA [Citrobacter portucalensis]
MSLNSRLEPELILLNEAPLDRNIVFNSVSNLLLSKNYVEQSYLEALIAREENHPTAMQLEKMGVAIPHVDVEHVREEKLVVVTCPEGIVFNQAEDPDSTMKVNVIFFLLLKEKDAHLEFLMKLISLFQRSNEMDQILWSKSKDDVMELLSKNLY